MIQNQNESMKPWNDFWLDRLEKGTLWVTLFLLWWQWRHVIFEASIGSEFFEYGSVALYAIEVLMLLMLGLAMRRRGWREVLGVVHPAVWGLVVFGVVWSRGEGVALGLMGHWMIGLVWASWVAHSVTKWSDVWVPAVSGAFAQALVGIGQYLINQSWGLRWFGESVLDAQKSGIPVVVSDEVRQLRAHGMMPHANIFGGVMSLVWAGLSRWGLSGGLPTIVAIVGLAVAVAVSFGRASWLVFVVVGLTGLVVAVWRHRPRLALGIAAGLLAFGIVLASQWSFVLPRVTAVGELEERSIGERIESVGVWQSVWGQDWLWGVGAGGYVRAVVEQNPGGSVWEYQPVHNGWLVVLAELGVVGVMILLSLVIWMAWDCRRGWSRVWWWLAALAALALVDHWPMTLHQGRAAWFFALIAMIWWHRHLSPDPSLDYNAK